MAGTQTIYSTLLLELKHGQTSPSQKGYGQGQAKRYPNRYPNTNRMKDTKQYAACVRIDELC